VLVLLTFCLVTWEVTGKKPSASAEQESVAKSEVPTIAGHPIDPATYHGFIEEGYLPLRPEMTDLELAQKLDLDLPQLAEVKAAVKQKDKAALEHALAAYLNTKLPPLNVIATDKPARDVARADVWLGDQVEFMGRTYKLGERLNWWNSVMPGNLGADLEPGFASWGIWVHPLITAYIDTGDPKYAEAILTYARSFYHNARPPAKRMTSWGDRWFMGPWQSLSASGRVHPGYMPDAYKTIGNFSGVTDTDWVMFLKMFFEHTDFCYQLTDTRKPHNFEVHVLTGLLNMALTFSEFRDSGPWLKRVCQRYVENMRDTVLEDGGSYERTGYHFAYQGPYSRAHSRLRDAGVPLSDAFSRGLEKMYEWSMWVLAPTLEFPLFGHGSLGPMQDLRQGGAGFFPGRADFAYVASGGKEGQPPSRIAWVLPHTGWATMRSDWSRDALYMAINYNGNHNAISSSLSHADLLSFGLWAYGRPWMTNSGSTANYGHPEYRDWCSQTISANTVLVDQIRQPFMDNAGRLESWASLPVNGPGFTYLAAVSDAYQQLGVSHRRAVLFVRPHYWLMYDRLSGDGKPHDYRWLGHFQPTQLAIDPATKAIATATQEGKRLWLIPAQPESFAVEQGTGAIVTREGNEESPFASTRKMAPYISFVRPATREPVAFVVLLYPAETDRKAPVTESLTVKEEDQNLSAEEAVGYRVRQGSSDDILALAQSSILRQYGAAADGLRTDGEAAYVRQDGGRIAEAGLVRGQSLDYGGQRLIKVGPDIVSTYVRYTGDQVEVSVQGKDEVSVAAGWATEVILNGQAVKVVRDEGRLKVVVGSLDELTLTKPTFSTAADDLGRAIGVPRPLALKNAVVVTWQSSVPTDATVEYCPLGARTWKRTVDPKPVTDHHLILSNLHHRESYQLHITCHSTDGRLATAQVTYTFTEPTDETCSL
jgi:hypothetical protein